MITAEIQIAVVQKGFVVEWTDERGIKQRQYCGNRDILAKTVHRAAESVRPTKYPMLTTAIEMIDIKAPTR